MKLALIITITILCIAALAGILISVHESHPKYVAVFTYKNPGIDPSLKPNEELLQRLLSKHCKDIYMSGGSLGIIVQVSERDSKLVIPILKEKVQEGVLKGSLIETPESNVKGPAQ